MLNKDDIQNTIDVFMKALNDNKYLDICNSGELITAIQCMQKVYNELD